MISNEEKKKYLAEGYKTGHIRLKALNFVIYILPNQFYADFGFNKVSDNPLGLCRCEYDTNGIIKTDISMYNSGDILVNSFVRGHEEGHALYNLGKSLEAYNESEKFGLDRLLRHYLTKDFIYKRDNYVIREMISIGLERNRQKFEKFNRISKKEKGKRYESIADICGLIAIMKQGHALKKSIHHLEKNGIFMTWRT